MVIEIEPANCFRLFQKGDLVRVGPGNVTTGTVAEDQRPGEQLVLVDMHTCGCAGSLMSDNANPGLNAYGRHL
jgi:hypothetical protein